MDLKKTGEMIARKRKEKAMTQKELAQRLGVTDKAVSRWETGAGFPDVSLLQPLSQALDIPITELITGEPPQPETTAGQSDTVLLSALACTIKKHRNTLGLLLALPGLWLAFAPVIVSGISSGLPRVLGAGLLAGAAALIFLKENPSRKVSCFLSALAHLTALILEILPGSAVLVFSGPDYYSREPFSCFDLTLVGFANFGPFLAAVLTAAATAMLIPLLLGKLRAFGKPAFLCTVLAGILVLSPALFLGSAFLTPSGLAVSFLLFTSAFFQHRIR